MFDLVARGKACDWDEVFPNAMCKPEKIPGFCGSEAGSSELRWVFQASSFLKLLERVIPLLGRPMQSVVIEYFYCGRSLCVFSGEIGLSEYSFQAATELESQLRVARKNPQARALRLGEWLVGYPPNEKCLFLAQYVLPGLRHVGQIFDFYRIDGVSKIEMLSTWPPSLQQRSFRIQAAAVHFFSASKIWTRSGKRSAVADTRRPDFVSFLNTDCARADLSEWYLYTFEKDMYLGKMDPPEDSYRESYMRGDSKLVRDLEHMSIWLPSMIEARLMTGRDPFCIDRTNSVVCLSDAVRERLLAVSSAVM